jgi:putative protease
VHFEVHGSAGVPLAVVARDDTGHVAKAESSMPLAPATNRPLTTERLAEQLGRLGGTTLTLGRLVNRVHGDVIVPVSELNRLRRELVMEIERQRALPNRWTLVPDRPAFRLSETAGQPPAGAAQLIVLVRSLPQLEAALECDVRTLYCELEDPKAYRGVVARFREWQAQTGAKDATIWVAPPRITKPGEEWMLNQVRSCEADGCLVRNYDQLRFFADLPRIGDFSFNVANPLAAEHFIGKFGLARVTASYDLNLAQLEALLQAAPPAWFEVTIHQHMPMFHMEHCVFCAFLSSGTDYTNCGRPCDKHEIKLRDRVGAEHPVKADAGCRNTVFNALAQTGAEGVSRLRQRGLRNFRIEFLNETADQVRLTIRKYRQLLADEISGAQVWRELKLLNQLGVTRGQMAGTEDRVSRQRSTGS